MIHNNILNSHVSFGQVWITIPQEIWSNHKKGKMVKIRVLTEEGQFLIFNLANDQLSSNMISRFQWHHLDLITCLKTSQLDWIDRWILQSTDQKSIVYWKVKLWLFWSKSSVKDHNSSKHVKYETCSSRNQGLKIRV